MGSEFWETDNLPRDFVSFIIGSEFCEVDNLPKLVFELFSFKTGGFPLDPDLDSV